MYQSKSIPSLPRAPGVGLFAGFSRSPALELPNIKGALLRLGRLFAAGQSRSHPVVTNCQRRVAPARDGLDVGSTSLFHQNGPGARNACSFSKRLSFINFGSPCETHSVVNITSFLGPGSFQRWPGSHQEISSRIKTGFLVSAAHLFYKNNQTP